MDDHKGYAPFDDVLGLLHHEFESYGRTVTWEPMADSLYMTLSLEGCVRGRSAAYFLFVDELTGKKYPMFLTDMEHLIKNFTPNVDVKPGVHIHKPGVFQGRWQVRKRGQNYGIRLVSTP